MYLTSSLRAQFWPFHIRPVQYVPRISLSSHLTFSTICLFWIHTIWLPSKVINIVEGYIWVPVVVEETLFHMYMAKFFRVGAKFQWTKLSCHENVLSFTILKVATFPVLHYWYPEIHKILPSGSIVTPEMAEFMKERYKVTSILKIMKRHMHSFEVHTHVPLWMINMTF